MEEEYRKFMASTANVLLLLCLVPGRVVLPLQALLFLGHGRAQLREDAGGTAAHRLQRRGVSLSASQSVSQSIS